MKSIYILILLVFINSYDYKIFELESYTYAYYAKDMIQIKKDTIIYIYEPKSENKNIFLLFLGSSNDGSFEFYLYKDLSDISMDENKKFLNYIEKFNNYGEINIKEKLDIYYILVKMNSYEDKYDYLNFMIYNTEEYWNIGEFKCNEEYVLGFENDKDIILTYPMKNITQILYIRAKGDCDEITYSLYKNNTEEELVNNIIDNCNSNQYYKLAFVRDNNYYIKLSFRSSIKNKIFRLVFYFLTNKKDIKEINNYKTDFKYGYTSYVDKKYIESDFKYFFINTTGLPLEQLIGFSIIEPFNSLIYKYWYKRYDNYDINELPNGSEVDKFDYVYYRYSDIEKEPFIFYRRYEDTKGLFLKIESYLNYDNDKVNHNEMVVYLYPKYVYDLYENHIFNHTELSEKKVFYLRNTEKNFVMKSNLEYFTILYPKIKRIRAKNYLFNSSDTIIELENSENALVEFKYFEDTIRTNLASPYIMFLCKHNIPEEKFLYLPYMTNFNILFGDIKVYDMNISLINSLDDFYDENYLIIYNSEKRYDDYLSLKDEMFFYKLKCNKYSLIKFEDSFKSYIDENITINQDSKKLILDFSRCEQKKINFESNLSINIGILNSHKLSENWFLNFYINNEKFSLNKTNNIFFQEFTTNDTLIIEKPDDDKIHPYLNVKYNYNIEKFRPLRTKNSGIFVFDKNITEEYNIVINISHHNDYYYYSILGKYGLFYGDPKNYEFNQLISYPIQMNNNPYQYLENNDENKSFFILFQNDPRTVYEEFCLIRYRKRNNIPLNELFLVENYENELVALYLPKFKESTHIFIQYFDEEMDVYNDSIKLRPTSKYYYGRERNVKEYKFNNTIELYATNENITAYKSFLLVSYVDIDYYKDDNSYSDSCEFKIEHTNDTYNDIFIEINNNCRKIFHYYIFITYNTSTEYNKMTPLELFYAKKNNDNIKCYEFTTNDNVFEIKDDFLIGKMNITIVGQSTEGFRRFVYDRKKDYYYIGKKKSYLGFIILGCIGGVIVIIIIVHLVIKYTRKRETESFYEIKTEKKDLINKEEEKAKNEAKSADFDYIKDTTDTPTPM